MIKAQVKNFLLKLKLPKRSIKSKGNLSMFQTRLLCLSMGLPRAVAVVGKTLESLLESPDSSLQTLPLLAKTLSDMAGNIQCPICQATALW
jgi:hypothetical protein